MLQNQWPDHLTAAVPERVQFLLEEFWRTLALLPDLVERQEHLLAEENTAQLRAIVLEMMLALNGINWPKKTQHLNTYLSTAQRQAIEKTLVAPGVDQDAWIGRAVALVVIYRWYAPQLTDRFALHYPQRLEGETWAGLIRQIPSWPRQVTSD